MVWVWIWKFAPKNVKFFNFFPSGQKKSLRVWSKSTWLKGKSATYLLWVKSKLGSGPIFNLQGRPLGTLQAFFVWNLRLFDVFTNPGSKVIARDWTTDSSIVRSNSQPSIIPLDLLFQIFLWIAPCNSLGPTSTWMQDNIKNENVKTFFTTAFSKPLFKFL